MKKKPLILEVRLPNTDHKCYVELNTCNHGQKYLDHLEFYISHGNGHKELVMNLLLNDIKEISYSHKPFNNGEVSFITYKYNSNLCHLMIDKEWYHSHTLKLLTKVIKENNRRIQMEKALFFDLDGTLWDALVPLTDSWNDAMESNGEKYRFTVDIMKSYMGLTPLETVVLAFPDVDEVEGMRLFKLCLDAEIKYLAKNPGILYPHEEEVISELSKKYPLYIVSNADKGYIENYLEACHMDKYFKGHINQGDTGLAKWENIKYLQEKEGIREIIYIGDTIKDKNESMKAGVKFVHAAYGFGTIEPDPFKINSLLELPSEVEKVFNK